MLREWIVAPFIFSVFTFGVAGLTFAQSNAIRDSFTPYCGLYSLYANLRMQGSTLQFEDLLKPEYVSSSEGSSPEDLAAAARHCGYNAKILGRLTISDLEALQSPAILLVRSKEGSDEYNHFVLLLSCGEDGVIFLDPPNPPSKISCDELREMWGGVAVVISRNPISVVRLAVPRMTYVLGITILAFTISLCASQARLLSRWEYACFFQSIFIILLASIAGIVFHMKSGFLAHPNATAIVDDANLGVYLPNVSADQAKRAIEGGGVLIDARLRVDYEANHIPGTINIPQGTSRAVRSQLLQGIQKKNTVIVFCKSQGCGFSTSVARDLIHDGFADVRIFRGGWDEWVKLYGKPISSATTREG